MAGAASGRQPGSAHHALGGSGRGSSRLPTRFTLQRGGGRWDWLASPPTSMVPRLHRYYVRLPKDRGIEEPPAEAGGKPSARSQRYSLCVLVASQLWHLKGQLCVEFNAALSVLTTRHNGNALPSLSSQRSFCGRLSWPKDN